MIIMFFDCQRAAVVRVDVGVVWVGFFYFLFL